MTEYEIFIDTLTKVFTVYAVVVAVSMPLVVKNLRKQGESLNVWVLMNTVALGLGLSALAGIYIANAPVTLNGIVLLLVTALCAFVAYKKYYRYVLK